MISQPLVTILVALIGAAGVIGAALATQVFGRKPTQIPNGILDVEGNDHFEQTGPLYQKIGRLEAELENCQEQLAQERAPQ